MKQYEAMFLFDPTFGNSFDKCEAEIRRLLERAQAEIILCRKWDERRLAYRVKGRKRGVYVLTYFNAPPDNITALERDAKLSENILRVLVLRADDLTRDAMERSFPHRAEEPAKSGGDADRRGRPSAEVVRTREAQATTEESSVQGATKAVVADAEEGEVIETE